MKISSQAISSKSRPRLPWPLPERPAQISVCASPLASYGIEVMVEARAKADPRAVGSFRCQRHAGGRAFPNTVLLQRVPLAGLYRQDAAAIFARLAAYLRDRAATDAILEAQRR